MGMDINPWSIEGLKLSLFGSEEKSQQITYTYTFAPKKQISVQKTLSLQETYAPSYTYAPHIIISSPYAQTKQVVSKKTSEAVEPQIIPTVTEITKMPEQKTQQFKFDASGMILLALGLGAIFIFMKTKKR